MCSPQIITKTSTIASCLQNSAYIFFRLFERIRLVTDLMLPTIKDGHIPLYASEARLER